MATAPGPVFVGGTGRSGSTVLGRLIGSHPRFAFVRTEIRFHVEPEGLPDLLAGKVELSEFIARMRTHWFLRGVGTHHPRGHAGRPRGLYKISSEDELRRALDRFEERFPAGPVDAARQLVEELLMPTLRAAGKPGWVETSPDNVMAVPTLVSVFPTCRVVHSIRDGRDVAASLVQRGLSSMEMGLDRWASKLNRVCVRTRDVDPAHLLTLSLYDLALDRREETYDGLLRFLGVPESRAMRTFFDTELSPERARIGRWRQEVSPAEQRAIDARYRRLLKGLRKHGVDVEPLMRSLEAPADTVSA